MYADKSEKRIITPDELERIAKALLDGIEDEKITFRSFGHRRNLLTALDVLLRVAAQARVAEAKGEPSLLFTNPEHASARAVVRLLDRAYGLLVR